MATIFDFVIFINIDYSYKMCMITPLQIYPLECLKIYQTAIFAIKTGQMSEYVLKKMLNCS
nr:hypothetical protein [Zobellia laminariae]